MMDTPVFTCRDLVAKLEPIRGRPIPLTTLKSWRRKIGMEPDRNKLYSQSDLDYLKGLIWAMKAGRTIEQYRRLKLMEQNNAN
jgi:DNA-binding transcriptional MerR regulator